MKKLILLVSLVSSSVFANQPNRFGLVLANVYNCESRTQSIALSFAATSKQGQPQLRYKRVLGAGTAVQTEALRQGEVTLQDTLVGTLASAAVHRIADGPSTYVTLVAPRVNLDPFKPAPTKVQTVVLETTVQDSIGGPEMVRGALESSKSYEVTCDVSYSVF